MSDMHVESNADEHVPSSSCLHVCQCCETLRWGYHQELTLEAACYNSVRTLAGHKPVSMLRNIRINVKEGPAHLEQTYIIAQRKVSGIIGSVRVVPKTIAAGGRIRRIACGVPTLNGDC